MPSISGETGDIGDWGADLGEVLGIDGVVGVPASGGVAGTAIRIGPAASPAGADRIMQVPPPFPNFGSVRPSLWTEGLPAPQSEVRGMLLDPSFANLRAKHKSYSTSTSTAVGTLCGPAGPWRAPPAEVMGWRAPRATGNQSDGGPGAV